MNKFLKTTLQKSFHGFPEQKTTTKGKKYLACIHIDSEIGPIPH